MSMNDPKINVNYCTAVPIPTNIEYSYCAVATNTIALATVPDLEDDNATIATSNCSSSTNTNTSDIPDQHHPTLNNTSHYTNWTLADTGATGHFLITGAHAINVHPTLPLTIKTHMQSRYTMVATQGNRSTHCPWPSTLLPEIYWIIFPSWLRSYDSNHCCIYQNGHLILTGH